MAEPPRVAVDIPPLHSLVAQVMVGIGTPDLILTPGVSPHELALRPSDAQALAGADLVVWAGPELSPAVARAVDTLASGEVLAVLDVPETVVLEFREGPVFEGHGDGEDPEEISGIDDSGGRDPHAWLDPVNAALWLGAIAESLARVDPDNSEFYARNAQAAAQSIVILQADIDARLDAVRGQPFVVFHDAYHYFEARFEMEAEGSIALGDGATPGPRRLAEITGAIEDLGVRCVFAEPQFNAGLVEVALADAGAQVGVIDPLGMAFEPGVGLYAELMNAIVASFETCLAPE